MLNQINLLSRSTSLIRKLTFAVDFEETVPVAKGIQIVNSLVGLDVLRETIGHSSLANTKLMLIKGARFCYHYRGCVDNSNVMLGQNHSNEYEYR